MNVETCLEDENFDPEFMDSVIAHMNQDHADALILYIRAFSEFDQVKYVTLLHIDRRAMRLIVTQNETGEGETDVSIKFDPPLRDAAEVRPRLVQMAKLARQRLNE